MMLNGNTRFSLFVLVLAGVFVAGLGAGYYAHHLGPLPLIGSVDRRLGDSEGLTNPLLDCAERIGLSSSGSLTLDHISARLREFQQKIAGPGGTARRGISVYLRDLNNGPWIGLNEDEILRPGSLLKVPLAVGYMHHSETDPEFLKNTVAYNNPKLAELYELQGVPPSQRLQPGGVYSLRELIERILIYSDNVAAVLLESYDHHKSMIQTSKDIDMPVRAGIPPFRNLTIKEYAAVFRILYNSSYLSRTNSEYLLQLLAKSEFRNGLVAGVRPGVVVAHKFGESIDEQTRQQFFHDCGIVYMPTKPYLLCVATRGDDPEEMMGWIQQVSRIVFEEIGK